VLTCGAISNDDFNTNLLLCNTAQPAHRIRSKVLEPKSVEICPYTTACMLYNHVSDDYAQGHDTADEEKV